MSIANRGRWTNEYVSSRVVTRSSVERRLADSTLLIIAQGQDSSLKGVYMGRFRYAKASGRQQLR